MLTPGTVAAVMGIVLVATVIQRLVGFGDALLAVPLMTLVVPLKSAVVIVLLIGTVTTIWLLVRFWSQVEWRSTGLLGAGTIIGAPFGVVVLKAVSAATLRVALGAVVCIAAVWIIASSRSGNPVGRARTYRTLVLGVASGVLSTSLATNGPPLVYELRQTDLADDRFRATISAAFMISNGIALPLLAAAGLISAVDLELACFSLLSCLIGIAVGSWISRRMQTTQFVWLVDLLLLSTGVITIAKAVS